MMETPVFVSIDSYGARLGDLGYWRPYAEAALASSGLPEQSMQSGFEGTYPTLVGDQLVVKLFGYFPGWRDSFAAETAANRAIERIAGISAPRIVACGSLFQTFVDHALQVALPEALRIGVRVRRRQVHGNRRLADTREPTEWAHEAMLGSQ